MSNPNGRVVHGKRYTATYSSWSCMKTRVLNENCKDHKYYEKIFGCIEPRWLEFNSFYKDMGDCALGIMFGVSSSTVSNARSGKSWKEVANV